MVGLGEGLMFWKHTVLVLQAFCLADLFCTLWHTVKRVWNVWLIVSTGWVATYGSFKVNVLHSNRTNWYQLVLRDEVETGMRLLGVTSLAQLRPGLINTQDIDHLLAHSLDEPNEVQYLKSKIWSKLWKRCNTVIRLGEAKARAMWLDISLDMWIRLHSHNIDLNHAYSLTWIISALHW